MNVKSTLYVAGRCGVAGPALVLEHRAPSQTSFQPHRRVAIDLWAKQAVTGLLAIVRPQYIFIATAEAGEIRTNNQDRANFI